LSIFINFFTNNFPTIKEFLIGFPPGVLWAYLCLRFSGELKLRKEWKTGYTRKVFHFLIFATAALVQTLWGIRSLCLFGGAASSVILYSIFRGNGNVLYEAMAREKDAPHRTLFIVVPYLATFAGGVIDNVFFANAVIFGYLITGLGDAIGEPIGTRFGKHQYSVPSLAGVKSKRSIEGSVGVFFASMAAIIIGILLSSEIQISASTIAIVAELSFICAIVEAVSPHGLDNAFMQIIPSMLASQLFL
jgi:phytol kinase